MDPDQSVPLYVQIAADIRRQILSGELAPGDKLEPLRRAAEVRGVNLHTVRHAYASLARDGLLDISRGRQGTRVRRDLPSAGPDSDVALSGLDPQQRMDAFLENMMRRAGEYGLEPAQIAEAIHQRWKAPGPLSEIPEVFVIECSRVQCEAHAAELERQYAVKARPWILPGDGLDRGPPPGPALATYFHYNDIRRLWPRHFGTIAFVSIAVDPELVSLLRAEADPIIVCERDEPTAEVVAADLISLVPDVALEIQLVVAADAKAAVSEADLESRVLLPPRMWELLGEEDRADSRAVEIRYRLDSQELASLAEAKGWRQTGHAADSR